MRNFAICLMIMCVMVASCTVVSCVNDTTKSSLTSADECTLIECASNAVDSVDVVSDVEEAKEEEEKSEENASSPLMNALLTGSGSSDASAQRVSESLLSDSNLDELDWGSFDASAASGGYGLGTAGAGAGGFGPGGAGGSGAYHDSMGSKGSIRASAVKLGNPGVVGRVPVFNTTQYTTFEPNGFKSVESSPLSTFGADVDTASYGIFRNYINHNILPEELPLRSEEMINYFHYDYPVPTDDQPFSVTTEISVSPWNAKTKLLQIGIQTRNVKRDSENRVDSNIVFLIDVSGSMKGYDRLELIKSGLINMLPMLRSNDRISIVTYAGETKTVLEGASPVAERSKIASVIQNLTADGWTEGGSGIQMAYKLAQDYFIQGGNNRVILATDGDLNVGMTGVGELTKLIEEKRKTGVFLSVLGVGMGNIKDDRLESIADHGNGNYHYLDTPLEAKKVLIDEFESTIYTVAKDAKFQIEFNPAKIKGYRQIGYESRKLEAEDFADDKKDGGEIGAEQQVTILYELVEADSDVVVPGVTRKYQKTETVPSDEWLTINIRYKEPDGDKSKLLSYPVGQSSLTQNMSDNMKFASAVAQTAMILNKSEFVGTATYESILKQLREIKNINSDEFRAEFVKLVESMPKGKNEEIQTAVLDKRIIQKIVRQHSGEIRQCYEKEYAKDKSLKGRVLVSWYITQVGSAKRVTIKDNTLNNKKVEDCVTKAVSLWRFPSTKGTGSMHVEYPFIFDAI